MVFLVVLEQMESLVALDLLVLLAPAVPLVQLGLLV